MCVAPFFVSFYTSAMGFGFDSYQSVLSLTAVLLLGLGFSFRAFAR
jgi:hypothetical protein